MSPLIFTSLVWTLLALGSNRGAMAQEGSGLAPSTGAQEDELRARIESLEHRFDEDLDDLLFEIEGLTEELDRLEARGTQTTQRANVFNPAITVFGNFLARTDDGRVYLDDDPAEARIDDGFNLREVEVDFRAAIDPWADGVLITSFESEVAGESNAGIEEGYVTLKRLPLLDSAPAGLKLKVGRFRPAFGRFNQIHLHDLPQTAYPRSLDSFLGAEGLIRDGIAGQFFLPAPGETQTLESSLGVFNGGGTPFAPDEAQSNLTILGNLKWFADLGRGRNLALGLSGLQNDTDHRLLGLDATFKWKPEQAGQWRSVLLGGELFQADINQAGLSSNATGFYLWSQVQFDRNLYCGVRYDRTEEISDADLVTDTYGAYLTYYTTEFLRLRLGLEHAESDLAAVDGRDSALFELNFIFGSHPTEPYWVNR